MATIDFHPARLHVLLARKAPVGLVFRRGPTKQVCTLGWNRETDHFTVGQWQKGRVYERRSDLSPDGKHLIYFAMNGKWDTPTRGSWTAISRAPYLKAIGLWPKGDTFHGGGLFINDDTYWINAGSGHDAMRAPSGLKRVAHYRDENVYGAECRGVYYLRLQRDGWKLIDRQTLDETHSVDVFEKPMPWGGVLRKLAHASSAPRESGQGSYYDEHELEMPDVGQKLSFPSWEWADVDRDRLVWAEGGKLFAAPGTASPVSTPTLLFDFNQVTFDPAAAPH